MWKRNQLELALALALQAPLVHCPLPRPKANGMLHRRAPHARERHRALHLARHDSPAARRLGFCLEPTRVLDWLARSLARISPALIVQLP